MNKIIIKICIKFEAIIEVGFGDDVADVGTVAVLLSASPSSSDDVWGDSSLVPFEGSVESVSKKEEFKEGIPVFKSISVELSASSVFVGMVSLLVVIGPTLNSFE